MWGWIIGGLLGLFGLGYGIDQHNKRCQEKAEYRRELARKEAQFRDLKERVGRHHWQVAIIEDEVERLRRMAA